MRFSAHRRHSGQRPGLGGGCPPRTLFRAGMHGRPQSAVGPLFAFACHSRCSLSSTLRSRRVHGICRASARGTRRTAARSAVMQACSGAPTIGRPHRPAIPKSSVRLVLFDCYATRRRFRCPAEQERAELAPVRGRSSATLSTREPAMFMAISGVGGCRPRFQKETSVTALGGRRRRFRPVGTR